MAKPDLSSIPEFYRKYVEYVSEDNLIPALINSGNITLELMKSIPETSGDFRYAEDKWSIKELLIHMMDAERIFNYRALRFARNDATELPGFNENDYVPYSKADKRTLLNILQEYTNLRASTVDLFSSFDEEALDRVGTSNGSSMSVRAIGFVIAGHETHHRQILNERYFSK